MKAAVVYWSMTGNTEQMAQAVAKGAEEAGLETELAAAEEFDLSAAAEFEAYALGCPAMGAEELEADVFEPLYRELIPALQGRKTVIFGSYDWGDGEWLRIWKQDCADNGIELAAEPLAVHLTPDADAIEACKSLGKALAG